MSKHNVSLVTTGTNRCWKRDMQNAWISISLRTRVKSNIHWYCEFIHRLYLSRPFSYAFISSWRGNMYLSCGVAKYNGSITQRRSCRFRSFVVAG